MTTTTFAPVTSAAIKRAIEDGDGRALAAFFHDDAVMRVVDRDNPPSKPREIRGRAALDAFWADICDRAKTHKVDVDAFVVDGDRLAFRQACTYPDGAKVLSLSMLTLRGGRIAEQTTLQAWDE